MAVVTDVVIALGANLGERSATLADAVVALGALEGLELTTTSPVVTTAPVGGPDQPDYLNAVVLARTTLAPAALLAALHAIEAAHGRERVVRWGARTLDLDLVAYGAPGDADEVVQDDPALTLPHPRAHERAFVLAPWAAADPHARLRLPDGRVADVRSLLEQAPDRAGVSAVPA
ncbi:MAG: 2-amino-4-hydroxy-6-hydroxymethyldihydropteridine diphosphokinase [Actinomycetota bacterium]